MTTTLKSMGLLLLLGLAAFSGNRAAQWEGTYWGMPIDKADRSFRIPHRKGPPWPGSSETGLTFGGYTTGNTTFEKGYLEFENDKLVVRGMSLADASNCSSLFETLRRQYGKPVYETTWNDFEQWPAHPTSTHQAWWEDPASNNRITLKNVSDPDFATCDLMYEPLKPLPGTHGHMELPPVKPAKLAPAPGGV